MPIVTGAPAASGAGRTLSKEEIQRYSRHLIMPEVGMEGQLKLARAKVLMIGAGGLGAPLGLYLAAAGVGRLGIVDFDVVDFTNLQRQVTFSTTDVGRPKIQAAKERLAGMNPLIRIDTYETKLSSSNALDLFRDYDIIVDGTDNFPTRYRGHDACVLLGEPNVYASIFSDSRDRLRCSTIPAAHAIAASIPNHRRRGSYRRAPKAACWVSCRASWARSRPWRRSS